MALIEGRGEEIGRFREVNRALVQISGYSPEQLLEMSYWDLVHPDEVETMRRGVAELVMGRSDSFQAELRMVGAGDVQRWIAFNVSLLRDADGRADQRRRPGPGRDRAQALRDRASVPRRPRPAHRHLQPPPLCRRARARARRGRTLRHRAARC